MQAKQANDLSTSPKEETVNKTEENRGEFNSVGREAESEDAEFLENVVREIDEVARSDGREVEIVARNGRFALEVGETGRANHWQ